MSEFKRLSDQKPALREKLAGFGDIFVTTFTRSGKIRGYNSNGINFMVHDRRTSPDDSSEWYDVLPGFELLANRNDILHLRDRSFRLLWRGSIVDFRRNEFAELQQSDPRDVSKTE